MTRSTDWMSFALADLAVRLSEKGGNRNDVMADVLHAALRGGVAHVACLPDANPIWTSRVWSRKSNAKAESLDLAEIYPLGALTQELKGEQLAEMATLVEHGCIALSQTMTNRFATHRYCNARSPTPPVLATACLATRQRQLFRRRFSPRPGAYASRLGYPASPVSAESHRPVHPI